MIEAEEDMEEETGGLVFLLCSTKSGARTLRGVHHSVRTELSATKPAKQEGVNIEGHGGNDTRQSLGYWQQAVVGESRDSIERD